MQAHVHANHPKLDKDVIIDGTFSLGEMQLLVTKETPPVISKGEDDPVPSSVSDSSHCPDFLSGEGTSLLISKGEAPYTDVSENSGSSSV